MKARFALALFAIASITSAQKDPRVLMGPDINSKNVPRYIVKSDGVIYDLLSPSKGVTGGVRVAVGDVNGDGVGDYITAQGPGGDNLIRIYDGATLALLSSFQAFKTDSGKGKGCLVCVGTQNEAGVVDTRIIVGSDAGGPPIVSVFDVKGTLLKSLFAFEPSFTGGVRVAAGDVDGDGRAEIICGAGPGMSPVVNIFDGASGLLFKSLMAGDPAFSGGVFVASGDVDGDGFADVITGAGSGGSPEVRKYTTVRRGDMLMNSYYAFRQETRFGVHVAAADLDGDGYAEIVVGAGVGGGSAVRIFHGKDDALIAAFTAYPGWNQGGGVWVAACDR